jgi:hypothetical protein
MHGGEFQLTDPKLFSVGNFPFFVILKANVGCSGPASVCPRAVVGLLEFAF